MSVLVRVPSPVVVLLILTASSRLASTSTALVLSTFPGGFATAFTLLQHGLTLSDGLVLVRSMIRPKTDGTLMSTSMGRTSTTAKTRTSAKTTTDAVPVLVRDVLPITTNLVWDGGSPSTTTCCSQTLLLGGAATATATTTTSATTGAGVDQVAVNCRVRMGSSQMLAGIVGNDRITASDVGLLLELEAERDSIFEEVLIPKLLISS